MVEPALLNQGWHLSKEGLERCKNGIPESRVESIIRNALDIDLRHIGLQTLPTDTNKAKANKIQGPMVLQIQKIRNISAPKANEDSGAAPPLLRLQLTDGHATIMAVTLSSISKISMSTPPGSKLKLTGSVSINHGFLLLTDNNCKLQGGNVEELVHKWELARSLAHHTRSVVMGTGGPPPWIPFSQRGTQQENNQKPTKITMKKSLEDPKPKEQTEQDKEFEEQRKATIQEINKSKQSQGKAFGGTKTNVTSHGREPAKRGFENSHGGRNSRRGDQYEEQATVGKPRSEGIYRDLNYRGYQPDEREILQLVAMGFPREAASNALRKHTGNIDAAIEMLVLTQDSGPSQTQTQTQTQTQRYDRQRPDTRPERGYGRKGRRGDDDEETSAPPAGPATLFDFLQPKLGKDKEKTSLHSSESSASNNTSKPRNFTKEQPYSVREAGIKFVHKGTGQGSNYYQPEKGQDQTQQGYNPGRSYNEKSGPRRDDFNRRQKYAGNESGVKKQDYDSQRGNNDGRNTRNDHGDRKQDNNSQHGRSARDFHEKSGPKRDDFNRGQRYTGNDSRDRKQDRSTDKENSNYRDRTSFRERRNDDRQKDLYQQRREKTRDEVQPSNEYKGNQRDIRGQGGQERSDRKEGYKPKDYQDSRPPRFQKQNDSPNETTNPPPGNKPRAEQSIGRNNDMNQRGGSQLQSAPTSSSHYSGSDAMQSPNLRPGEPCQAKYWEDGQFYNAVLTAVHPSGRTCVVLFLEYGNHEEVKMTDIRPVPSQAWIGPSQVLPGPQIPTLLMSANPGQFEGSTQTQLEFRKGGEGTAYQKSRQQREARQNLRPSQSFYQPPTSKK